MNIIYSNVRGIANKDHLCIKAMEHENVKADAAIFVETFENQSNIKYFPRNCYNTYSKVRNKINTEE